MPNMTIEWREAVRRIRTWQLMPTEISRAAPPELIPTGHVWMGPRLAEDFPRKACEERLLERTIKKVRSCVAACGGGAATAGTVGSGVRGAGDSPRRG